MVAHGEVTLECCGCGRTFCARLMLKAPPMELVLCPFCREAQPAETIAFARGMVRAVVQRHLARRGPHGLPGRN